MEGIADWRLITGHKDQIERSLISTLESRSKVWAERKIGLIFISLEY